MKKNASGGAMPGFNSTATGFFALSGFVSADINGVTYSDPFSGYATFNGSYMTKKIADYTSPPTD